MNGLKDAVGRLMVSVDGFTHSVHGLKAQMALIMTQSQQTAHAGQQWYPAPVSHPAPGCNLGEVNVDETRCMS